MKINEIIKKYRKKENLTQQQVASYLNVSTPAVNKWEKGISYPDITLLPPLARVLKTDVNTLLTFNQELTAIEINNFTKDISEIVSKEGYEKAFKVGNDLIKEYSSCDDLMFNIATVLKVYLTLCETEEKDKYEKKIIEWFQLLQESSKESIASNSKILLSSIYKEKKEYEQAQNIIDKIPELYTGKKFQQASLFESMGKINEAYGIYEGILLKNANETYSVLSLIIELLLKENKFKEAEEYVKQAKKLVNVFELGAYNKYLLELSLAKEKQDREKTIEIIISLINEASSMMDFTKSKRYKHMKFNLTNGMNMDEYKKMIKMSLKEDKTLDFIKNDSRIKSLLK